MVGPCELVGPDERRAGGPIHAGGGYCGKASFVEAQLRLSGSARPRRFSPNSGGACQL